MKITILGYGEVGSANARYFKSLGHTCYMYDPPKRMNRLHRAELYVVNVPSTVIEQEVRQILSHYANPRIAIESTITQVGLTRRLSELTPELCYCPQRYWANDPQQRGVQRTRLIGAVSQDVLDRFTMTYKVNLGMDVIQTTPEVAEWTKLVENAYRGLQIAFAEETKMLVGDLYDTVREGVMTADDMHWLAEARKGIGGTCIPLAMSALRNLILIDTARQVDTRYKEWLKNERVPVADNGARVLA